MQFQLWRLPYNFCFIWFTVPGSPWWTWEAGCLYNGRLLTCRLVGTYSLHHILNRSHYRPAPSSRRHHTHYSCIITQYTCLHRRQCVQSLQVPYQWFCTESPGWRGQQWDFHIQLLALSEDCRSISGYICRQYFAKNTCRPLLYPLSPLWLPSCTCHSDFVCTIL